MQSYKGVFLYFMHDTMKKNQSINQMFCGLGVSKGMVSTLTIVAHKSWPVTFLIPSLCLPWPLRVGPTASICPSLINMPRSQVCHQTVFGLSQHCSTSLTYSSPFRISVIIRKHIREWSHLSSRGVNPQNLLPAPHFLKKQALSPPTHELWGLDLWMLDLPPTSHWKLGWV